MLGGMIFLVNGFGSFDRIFTQLEGAGAFSFIIPFLFIFSIVFGILSKTKIFDDNKGIYFIISLAVSLMSLQTNVVSDFLTIVSPLLGMGLVIMLLVMIFLGLVAPKEAWLAYTLFGIGAIVLVNILLDVAQSTGSRWWDWWVTWEAPIILGIVIYVVYLMSKGDSGNTFGNIANKFVKGLTD